MVQPRFSVNGIKWPHVTKSVVLHREWKATLIRWIRLSPDKPELFQPAFWPVFFMSDIRDYWASAFNCALSGGLFQSMGPWVKRYCNRGRLVSSHSSRK